MSRGRKYDPLENYLRKAKEDHIVLSFEEIESIIGDHLPDSAFEHSAWWSNDTTSHTHTVWIKANFMTINVSENMRNERAEFVRPFQNIVI